MAANSYTAKELADILERDGYIDMQSGEDDFETIIRALRSDGPKEAYIDRSEAVNLARNVLAQRSDPEITTKGIVRLARAVLDMDEWICLHNGPSDRKDAERYRWLRERNHQIGPLAVVARPDINVELGADCPSGARLDSAIDYWLDAAQEDK